MGHDLSESSDREYCWNHFCGDSFVISAKGKKDDQRSSSDGEHISRCKLIRSFIPDRFLFVSRSIHHWTGSVKTTQSPSRGELQAFENHVEQAVSMSEKVDTGLPETGE